MTNMVESSNKKFFDLRIIKGIVSIAITILTLVFFPYVSSADTPSGQAGAFLRMAVGARAIGMGNAITGLARDGYAGFYNPGSLPFMDRPELAFSLGLLSLDRTHSFVGFSTFLQPKLNSGAGSGEGFRGGFALGWVHAGVSDIDARNSDGRHLGMLSNSENAFFASFALQPAPIIGVGMTIKVVMNRFPGLRDDGSTISANGFGFDLGVYATPVEKLSVGAVLKDINTKYTWDTEGLWERGSKTINNFPKLLRFGAAYRLPRNSVLSTDLEFNEEQGWRIHLGGEIDLRESFTARAGFNDDRLTFGFGFRFKLWHMMSQMDYAYDTISITPNQEQYISWRLIL